MLTKSRLRCDDSFHHLVQGGIPVYGISAPIYTGIATYPTEPHEPLFWGETKMPAKIPPRDFCPESLRLGVFHTHAHTFRVEIDQHFKFQTFSDATVGISLGKSVHSPQWNPVGFSQSDFFDVGVETTTLSVNLPLWPR